MTIRGRVRRWPYAAAAVVALLTSACTASPSDPRPDAPGDAQITIAWDGQFSAYNNQTTSSAGRNEGILASVLSGFWRLDGQGNVVPQPNFGIVAKVSDKPLTVRYTINPQAVWSDGKPIDCDDILLAWAAHSGQIRRGSKQIFDGTPTSTYRATKPPACAKGSKVATVVYSSPDADWRSLFGGSQPLLPAHVVERATGVSEAALIQAIRTRDSAKLAPVAAFWNKPQWASVASGTFDRAAAPSSGPYLLDSWSPNQTLTLKANPRWWGSRPKTDRVVFRYVEAGEMPQALLNGEVDVISPPADIAIVDALRRQGSATVIQRHGILRYEQLQFNLTSKFSDPVLRRAFASCLPRGAIVEQLVQPIDADAAVLNARLTLPFEDRYRSVVHATTVSGYSRPDNSRARQLLESRKATGTEVRIAYDAANAKRASEVAQIKAGCDLAGFSVQGAAVNDLPATPSANRYDVALTDVTLSPFPAAAASSIPAPSAKVKALVSRLRKQPEPAAQNQTIQQIEKQLWVDLATMPLYTYPGITAWRGVSGVSPVVDPTQLTWNLAEWEQS